MFKLFLISILFICFFPSSAFAINNELYFFGSYKTNFVIIDPLGRKTGFDIGNNQSYKEIPNSAYWESGFGGPNEPQPDNFMELQIKNPIDGIYKIKITGNKLGKILVDISYPCPLSAPQPKSINYISDVNKVDYFEVNYSYATGMAGQIMPVTHIASSSTLIDDINVMQKMGYIGDAHFVSEIIEKINKIEKERLEPQKPDGKSDKEKKKDDKPKLTPAQKAKKEYTELLSEITEKYNKPESDEFVKQEAYTVLREDLEYIINHIQ